MTITTNKTAFSQFTRDELIDVCEEFGVEVNAKANKQELLARLAEDGVQFSIYEAAHPSETVIEETSVVSTIPAVVAREAIVEDKILIKMTRNNASFEARGVKFTRENPYALVKESDAEFLIGVLGGFQIAMPTEVANYYK